MFDIFQNMRNCIAAAHLGLRRNEKFLLLCMSAFITFLTPSNCDGEATNTAMFEIPKEDQKLYMLKDCRKMAEDNIDCKCVHLGQDCHQAAANYVTNSSCLDGSTRIFYVKKRYGGVCVSETALQNAGTY